jgi:hypothetical protein
LFLEVGIFGLVFGHFHHFNSSKVVFHGNLRALSILPKKIMLKNRDLAKVDRSRGGGWKHQ